MQLNFQNFPKQSKSVSLDDSFTNKQTDEKYTKKKLITGMKCKKLFRDDN